LRTCEDTPFNCLNFSVETNVSLGQEKV